MWKTNSVGKRICEKPHKINDILVSQVRELTDGETTSRLTKSIN
jgi:hypothetical protein